MAAAVADYRPAIQHPHKVKRGTPHQTLELEMTPDILAEIGRHKKHRIVVGFAAETHDLEAYARRKLEEKNLDWIVANDVSRPGQGMDAENNAIVLLGGGEPTTTAQAGRSRSYCS